MYNVQVGEITLTFDKKHYPQLMKRYTPEQLAATFESICRAAHAPLTEASLYSSASVLECDLTEMFG